MPGQDIPHVPLDDPCWGKDNLEGSKGHDTLTKCKRSHQAHSLTAYAVCHLRWRRNLQWKCGKFYKWGGGKCLCKCTCKYLCSCFAFHTSRVSDWRFMLADNKSNKFSISRLLCLRLKVEDIHSNVYSFWDCYKNDSVRYQNYWLLLRSWKV